MKRILFIIGLILVAPQIHALTEQHDVKPADTNSEQHDVKPADTQSEQHDVNQAEEAEEFKPADSD